MFTSRNIPALFKKGMLKLEKNEDGEYRRVAEATCLIEPFPPALARELGEEIAVHLFDDDNAIRPELESIDLRVRAGLQNVTVRANEDLDPLALITPASVKDVNATVVEDKKAGRHWMAFSFVLVFSLEDKEARNFVLDQFGRTLLWSFERLQGDLLATARVMEAAARLGDTMGPDVSVTVVSASPDGSTTGPTTFDGGTSKRLREVAKTLRQASKAH